MDKISSKVNLSNGSSESVDDSWNDAGNQGGAQEIKKFLPRNSLLNDLFESEHFRAVRRILTIIITLFIIKETAESILHSQKLRIGIELLLWNFSGIFTSLGYWLGMMASTVMLFFGFQCWEFHRMKLSKLPKSKDSVKNWDYCCLASAIVYFIGFLCIPCSMLLRIKIPIASSTIIATEQVRLLMKKYAYLRSNVPEILRKTQDDKEHKKLSNFLYFLFAPTLVYSDSYPRKKECQWSAVMWHFFGFAEAVFYWALLYDHFILPNFENFGAEPFSAGEVIVKMINCSIPGLLLLICGFYFLLHGWMNAFAEMMQFSDCMFYKDWWTSSNISVYYRTWNVLVGDWLYIYVYKDIAELLGSFKDRKSNESGSCSNVIPIGAVFLISAIFHEYILTCCLGFFYPVLSSFFIVFGVFLLYPQKMKGITANIFILASLGIGKGLIVGLYAMEWYSRKNCASQMDPKWDFFTPRSWYCNQGLI